MQEVISRAYLSKKNIFGNFLDLSYLDLEDIKVPIKYLSLHPSKEILNLSGNHFTDKDIESLTHYLVNERNCVKSLYLKENKLTALGAKTLCQLFNYFTRIQALDLSGNNIKTDGFRAIIRAIKTNSLV